MEDRNRFSRGVPKLVLHGFFVCRTPQTRRNLMNTRSRHSDRIDSARRTATRKLVLTAMPACLAFVLNTLVYFPAMAPFQHFVNALSAVFVGPWYGAAAGGTALRWGALRQAAGGSAFYGHPWKRLGDPGAGRPAVPRQRRGCRPLGRRDRGDSTASSGACRAAGPNAVDRYRHIRQAGPCV